MQFKQFADLVNTKFNKMAQQPLFKSNVPKEVLWDTYQNTFSPADNPIFRERRVHECNMCYSFIKRLGPVVSINDGKLDTIWNIPDLQEPYKSVASALHELVSNANVASVFLADESLVGKEYTTEFNNADITWEHFYADIPAQFISQSVATDRGNIDTTVSVYKRALEEFSISSLESVIDLCDSIYRGSEFAPTVRKFLEAKIAYESSNKALFIWETYNQYPAKIRNTAIGTLIIDIEKGIDLEEAVKKYEAVVAPANYKRTSAVVTEGMKKSALTTIDSLNLRDSLPRRHATLDDVSVNDVLFASRDSQAIMKDPLDEFFAPSSTPVIEAPKGSTTVSIEAFLADILPHSQKVEALVENSHTPNFVSLVAPQNPQAPSMLKWDNNFSWSYNGEVTDSMKEKVKAAGGNVTGDLRFSIQWNENLKDRANDLDAHCLTPTTEIYYSNSRDGYGGELDVDITRPSNNTAVENITWPNRSKMIDGTYKFFVNNFNGRNTEGFRAQIEFDGQIFEYDYPTSVGRDVPVATVTLKNGKFTIKHHLDSASSQKEEWSISTLSYQPVSTIMLSPNFWNGQSIGNKHYFFMLEGCKNPSDVRGFYNEFLSEDLRPHRKVFETLSASMKCTPTDSQLSGLGFSSTVANTLSVKVDGRPYQITFKDN